MFHSASGTTPRTRRHEDRPMRHVLVTGGCGFIGSNFINSLMHSHPDIHIFNLDIMGYCANGRAIEHADSPQYHFIQGDITDSGLVRHLLSSCEIDTVVHFAAQSHVDNSFGNSLLFTRNNVLGTHVLLECVRDYDKVEKFIHVSTDEVYGEVDDSQVESGTLNPTNPYAATKAAAECIVKSYYTSFGLPVIITRSNNAYGRYQYPEKIVPRFLMLAHLQQPLTIQGTGANTRMFIHVDDLTRAFTVVLERGVIGEVYNIGTREERSVLDVARLTIACLRGPEAATGDNLTKYLAFVKDRDFNDQRYDIDSGKMEALGWKAEMDFETGFRETAEWYVRALDEGFWPSIQDTICDASTSMVAAEGVPHAVAPRTVPF